MNFVKDGKDHFDRVLVSIVWFGIVFAFGNLLYWAIKYPYIPFTIKDHISVGVLSYLAYLIFRVLLVSFKSTFFEVKLKNEEQLSGTEKYYQWYFGKEPYIFDSFGQDRNIIFDPEKGKYVRIPLEWDLKKEDQLKYHYAENLVYETYSNRRFWNVFCPFIRTDELTLEEIESIVSLTKKI